MRISDWSSDVCSSDLHVAAPGGIAERNRIARAEEAIAAALVHQRTVPEAVGHLGAPRLTDERDMVHIGAAVGPLIGARQRRGRVALMKPLARDRRVVEIVGQGGKQRRGFGPVVERSEEHTSEIQSLMRISYAVFCLKKKNNQRTIEK